MRLSVQVQVQVQAVDVCSLLNVPYFISVAVRSRLRYSHLFDLMTNQTSEDCKGRRQVEHYENFSQRCN